MTHGTFKATVEIGDKKVTVEGPREFVEEQLAKLADLATSKRAVDLLAEHRPVDAPGEVLTERQLIEAKRPKGHLETVAVLAFALAQAGAEEFTEDDMRRAYLRSGTRPPKVVSQALRDAKNRLDYIEAGARKGTYRLTHHGDRTVRFDLPRSSLS